MRFRLLNSTAAAALMACTGLGLHLNAQAEDWPTKPVVMVVPYSAGGPTDVVARMLAIPMGKVFFWKQRTERAAHHQLNGSLASQRGGGFRRNELTVAQNGNTVRNSKNFLHAMPHKHHCDLTATQIFHHHEQTLYFALRQGGGRLIHDQHLRIQR